MDAIKHVHAIVGGEISAEQEEEFLAMPSGFRVSSMRPDEWAPTGLK